MTTMDQNGLNGRDLRIKLFDLMKSKGIVDNVKTHLRGRLINELRGGVDNQIRFSSSTTQPTLLIRALNALIIDYFQGQRYDYTTSVFIPEANINDYRTMSDEEILRLLNISTESSFYKKIKSNNETNGHTSLLMTMLTCISSWLPGSSQNNSAQTSNDLWAGSVAGSTLETDRLKRLEDDIRKREVTLSNTEIHVDQQVQMKLNKLRFEIEQQFTERDKNFQLMEMRNQEEARRLSEERLLAEQAKTEVASLRKHYSEADSTIHRLQSDIKILQNENEILREKTKQIVDYQAIREENAVLKSQMNNITSRSQRSHQHHHNSSSSSPREQSTNSQGIIRELKTVLDNQQVGQKVVNDELIDLKTQIALLQSSNQPEPYFNGRFPSNHGGDYLSHVIKSTSDVQLNQSRYSTSSNYNQFIEDAKLRMLELDREADRVEESYRDYQHRIMTKTPYTSNIQPTDLSQQRVP
ncbi:unnamed protein product [Rotaria sordida]|uniref:LisH domain-containing protein n=1 Tax=Rotaria sordida TaxID=392033 RepID=A0A815ACE6_9BILA|nr:unnamed protein product [Rotaria sordida]